MIFKYELIEAINGLSHDLTALSIKVSDLEKEVKALKAKVKKNAAVPVKIKKKIAPQPRGKDGKFAKRK